MAWISCTVQAIIDLYNGGVGPCNTVYSLDPLRNLKRVAFLSETQVGQLTVVGAINETISEQAWLAAAAANQGAAGPLEPILVEDIDLNKSLLTCTAAVILRLIGALQTGPIIYSLSATGKIAKAAFLHPTDQGRMVLGMQTSTLSEIMTEATWLTQITTAVKVADIDLANL